MGVYRFFIGWEFQGTHERKKTKGEHRIVRFDVITVILIEGRHVGNVSLLTSKSLHCLRAMERRGFRARRYLGVYEGDGWMTH